MRQNNRVQRQRNRRKEGGEDRRIQEYIEKIYPRENKREKRHEIEKQKKKVWVCLGVLTVFSLLYCIFYQPESLVLQEKNQIHRQEENISVTMEVNARNPEKNWQKEITLDVVPKQFNEEEKEELHKRTENYLVSHLPGKNESLLLVKEPLVLADKIPDTDIQLEWFYEDTYLRADGSLNHAAIPKEGVDTEVSVKAVCRNWEKTYDYSLHLLPVTESEEEKRDKQIKTAVTGAMKEQSTERVVLLPKQVGDMTLSYQEKTEKSYALFLVMLFLCGCMPFLFKERQKRKLVQREEQMLMDHPGMVNKIMLLLGAGLTLRKCVERMSAEYERERENGGAFRYAYEELCIMNQEMRDGISEGEAMEHFGKRCCLLPYLRFSSIITQNLKKGADGLLAILERESMEALEQRKERVLQMGEKAGTKLLFPMMIMLGLVMGIIMVPAFMTM